MSSLPTVMISYNHKASSELALKLNSSLKAKNIKTWIDIERMSGDIFKDMAHGVESSDVVLIILSNEYCGSDNCIRECEYAVSQNKRLLTVKHDKEYKPRGPVGLITSVLLYIDFTKNDFGTQFETLLAKINSQNTDNKYHELEKHHSKKPEIAFDTISNEVKSFTMPTPDLSMFLPPHPANIHHHNQNFNKPCYVANFNGNQPQYTQSYSPVYTAIQASAHFLTNHHQPQHQYRPIEHNTRHGHRHRSHSRSGSGSRSGSRSSSR